MSFLTLPRELLILISNYEPKIILLTDCSNWHNLIKQNFGLEYSISIPKSEIQKLYFEKCMKYKSIFAKYSHTIIKLTDGTDGTSIGPNFLNSGSTLMSCGSNAYGQLGHGDRINRDRFEEIGGILKYITSEVIICSNQFKI